MVKRENVPTVPQLFRIREAYGDVPIIIGGLEASLRRFAHYDYWSNTVRRSILVDSRADILTYGMGENILLRIASLLDKPTMRKATDISIKYKGFTIPAEFVVGFGLDYDELYTVYNEGEKRIQNRIANGFEPVKE